MFHFILFQNTSVNIGNVYLSKRDQESPEMT